MIDETGTANRRKGFLFRESSIIAAQKEHTSNLKIGIFSNINDVFGLRRFSALSLDRL